MGTLWWNLTTPPPHTPMEPPLAAPPIKAASDQLRPTWRPAAIQSSTTDCQHRSWDQTALRSMPRSSAVSVCTHCLLFLSPFLLSIIYTHVLLCVVFFFLLWGDVCGGVLFLFCSLPHILSLFFKKGERV